MASVLGREFRLDVLAAMTGFAIDTVLEAMEQGGRAGLVLEMPDEVSRFGFVHALIRETLYQDLSRSRRAQAHLRAAEADPSRAALLAAEGQTLRANQQDARNLIAAERHTLNRRTFTPTDHDTLRAAITHRTTTIYQQAISDRPEWLIEILTELDDRGTLAQLRLGQLRELVKAVAINKDCDIASATVALRRPSPSMSMPRTV